MTRGQLALMRALFVTGVLVLAAGILVLVVDMTSVEPDCHKNLSGYEICREGSASMRGVGIGAIGFLIITGTMIGWSTLPPLEKRPARSRPDSPTVT